MRVCMILEGCYPYVHGGVSSWMHQYIQAMPDVEFVLWCIGANAKDKDKFKYEIPENVVEIVQVFLDDALELEVKKRRKLLLTTKEKEALTNLTQCREFNWDDIFPLFQEKRVSPIELLMSYEFLDMLKISSREKFANVSFSKYFHTIRSMLLPELYLLTTHVPEADCYHSTATGYGGLLASLAKWKYKKPFILTEHGIYTREREEELLRATWVLPFFKQAWIDLFYTFSACAYTHADVVTALFNGANRIQQEIGCDKKKTRTIANGVHYERFSKVPLKEPDEYIDIGAVIRIAKIKDVKTLLYAFMELKTKLSNVRLHILGDVDDEEYYEECLEVIKQNKIEDVIFTGMVDVISYMEKIDFTILTSISEGQPLSVLESFAARRPVVVTDVGCCMELVKGCFGDKLGYAGYCVPPMNKGSLANAMYKMSTNHTKRLEMGKIGQKRVQQYYMHEDSMENYRKLYQEVMK